MIIDFTDSKQNNHSISLPTSPIVCHTSNHVRRLSFLSCSLIISIYILSIIFLISITILLPFLLKSNLHVLLYNVMFLLILSSYSKYCHQSPLCNHSLISPIDDWISLWNEALPYSWHWNEKQFTSAQFPGAEDGYYYLVELRRKSLNCHRSE